MFFLSIHTIHITNLKKKNSETFLIISVNAHMLLYFSEF